MGLLSAFRPRKQAAAGAAVPVTEAPVGVFLVVDAVSVENPVRSDRLASLGLVAGCEVVLRQRRPTFVLDVGETTLALDREIATGIRVRLP
ncbi:FeoA family protein [Vulgatibacter sp.]|uniref:FeoA family protein n=1 Tax=Vulgatibacter sp. TaxID=1971226 RepID=UPI0035655D94